MGATGIRSALILLRPPLIFFSLIYIFGLVTKSSVLFGFPALKSEGGCASLPPLCISLYCVCIFSPTVCLCSYGHRELTVRLCVFFASWFLHFAPICFMLAVRSHLCQCFVPSVRVSGSLCVSTGSRIQLCSVLSLAFAKRWQLDRCHLWVTWQRLVWC